MVQYRGAGNNLTTFNKCEAALEPKISAVSAPHLQERSSDAEAVGWESDLFIAIIAGYFAPHCMPSSPVIVLERVIGRGLGRQQSPVL